MLTIGCVVLLVLLPLVMCQELRPIFNFAHMVNSIEEVSQFLDEGATAIEFDVNFHDNGTADDIHHGFPCDCFRNCFKRADIDDFLDYIRSITNSDGPYKGKLLLLLMDMKTSDVPAESQLAAGSDIASRLINHLWNNVPSNQAMNVILSIESADEKEILRSAITAIQNHDSTLLNRLGFDVGQSSSMEDIGDMYAELNITGHRWYDEGITNCLNFLFDTNQLEAPIANREADDVTSFVDKAYFWTTDLKSTMREVLRLGVDGILTNKPEFVIEVLNEEEFKESVRLANAEDNPWMRFP